jgi:hypothetical protein
MMQLVCDAFLSDQAIEVIVTLLAEPLSRHPKMNDRDVSLVELVIIFLRNLLAATAPPPGALFRERENARRIHSGLLSKFQEAEVLDLLCIIAQRAREVSCYYLLCRDDDDDHVPCVCVLGCRGRLNHSLLCFWRYIWIFLCLCRQNSCVIFLR